MSVTELCVRVRQDHGRHHLVFAQIVGTFNRETNEMDLTDPKLLQEAGSGMPGMRSAGPSFEIGPCVVDRMSPEC